MMQVKDIKRIPKEQVSESLRAITWTTTTTHMPWEQTKVLGVEDGRYLFCPIGIVCLRRTPALEPSAERWSPGVLEGKISRQVWGEKKSTGPVGVEEPRDRKEELWRWDSRREGSRVREVRWELQGPLVYLMSMATYATKKKSIEKEEMGKLLSE